MLVIVHGWNEGRGSGRALARRLAALPPEGIGEQVTTLCPGDDLRVDDATRFADLAAALDRAWRRRGLPRRARSVDVVTHGPAALIVREWMTQYFAPGEVPIRRLLMLAPTNFGTPLAQGGRSLIGRALRGWQGSSLPAVGAGLREALALAGPYTEALAQRDCFGGQRWYGPGGVLATVLCGNCGLPGIAAVGNRPGTDGVTRLACANLNALRIGVDFSGPPTVAPALSQSRPPCTVAFGIADGEDHLSIAGRAGGPRRARTLALMRRALSVDDAGYPDWCSELQAHNQAVTEIAEARDGTHYHSFHNAVLRAVDDAGFPVRDYVVELYVNDDRSAHDRRRTQRIQEEAVVAAHSFSGDASRRNLLIDVTRMRGLLELADDRLYIGLTASPEVEGGSVGYCSYRDTDIGHLELDPTELRALFRAHGTSLITLTIKRRQGA